METREHARALRASMTESERRLWARLRRGQLGARFRRQVPIGLYIADFACFTAGVIVELDGGQHATQAAADLRRDEWFTQQGFRTLRFWNSDLVENLDAVVERIRAALV